ncbi:hypothetical protein K2Y00_03040 [Patescibacteria group bacterium]|nr:hypothetical protein [Patescibacteria group bacterium]
MKQLLLGVVLLVLIGIAGFFYRNAIEGPGPIVACPLDAKLCPDGSSVGRVLPTCEFAACLAAEGKVSYSMPAGYTADENAYGADTSLLDAFVKSSLSENPKHTITVREYMIPEGQTANDVIIANTTFYPSDMPAESMDQFEPVTVNGKTYQSVVIERFEAIVHSAYFLPLEGKVLKFEIVEHDVMDWMEPTLAVKKLPEHAAFIQMLGTVSY